MRRVMLGILAIILLAGVIGFWFMRFGIEREPRQLLPKFEIEWQDKEKFVKKSEMLGLPTMWPGSMFIKGGHLYLTEYWNERLQVLEINFDGSLSPKFIFDKTKKEALNFSTLRGLAIKGNYLYVTDTGNHCIQILKINPDGSLSSKFSFGEKGDDLGEFSAPVGLAIKGNYLYVTDTGNHRIQILKINPDGSLSSKFSFGAMGRSLGEFNYGSLGLSVGLAIKGNYLYVTDTGNHRIQILKINPDGSLSSKFSFGEKGDDLGEFSAPVGLAIKGNYLYVGDTGNFRIQVLEIKY